MEKYKLILGNFIEAIEVLPSLVILLSIIALAIFFPKATILQYIYTVLGAEIFARLIRKYINIYKFQPYMCISILFERMASYYIDSIIIIIISSFRFTYYYSIAYVIIALLCHFIFIGTYKNRLSLHNRLAIYAVNKYGNSYKDF